MTINALESIAELSAHSQASTISMKNPQSQSSKPEDDIELAIAEVFKEEALDSQNVLVVKEQKKHKKVHKKVLPAHKV